MRNILTLSAAFLLAGCAVPPAVTIASLAVDGFSYAATGKSTTDHALSAITREDCAVLRVLKEEAVCSPEETLVGMVETPPAADEEALPAAVDEGAPYSFRDEDN